MAQQTETIKVSLTRTEWETLLKEVQYMLRNVDPFNEPLKRVYQDITFQLDDQEEED